MNPTFFGISLPFLILSVILKNKQKICTWEVLIISHYTVHKRQVKRSNLYMDTGVRDLGAAFFKVLPDVMTNVAKIYQIGLYVLC